jgi:hypothetical protein
VGGNSTWIPKGNEQEDTIFTQRLGDFLGFAGEDTYNSKVPEDGTHPVTFVKWM